MGVSEMRRVGAGLVVCAYACVPTAAAETDRLAFDVSAGATGQARRVAATVSYSLFRPARWLDLGIGARFSAHFGDVVDYENRDAITIALPARLPIDPAVYAMNLALFGEVRLARWAFLGANLDVLGAAVGPPRRSGARTAKPQTLSHFAYGTNDHGALNSELYLAARLGASVDLRAGLSHYVTNYIVTAPGEPDARYQRFESAPFLAVRWRLGPTQPTR
jgi:hypothetical protein